MAARARRQLVTLQLYPRSRVGATKEAAPSDSLPPVKTQPSVHYITFLIVLPAGNQMFKHMRCSYGGCATFKAEWPECVVTTSLLSPSQLMQVRTQVSLGQEPSLQQG